MFAPKKQTKLDDNNNVNISDLLKSLNQLSDLNLYQNNLIKYLTNQKTRLESELTILQTSYNQKVAEFEQASDTIKKLQDDNESLKANTSLTESLETKLNSLLNKQNETNTKQDERDKTDNQNILNNLDKLKTMLTLEHTKQLNEYQKQIQDLEKLKNQQQAEISKLKIENEKKNKLLLEEKSTIQKIQSRLDTVEIENATLINASFFTKIDSINSFLLQANAKELTKNLYLDTKTFAQIFSTDEKRYDYMNGLSDLFTFILFRTFDKYPTRESKLFLYCNTKEYTSENFLDAIFFLISSFSIRIRTWE